jgi:prepilin-type N-terminal cleavage/methylation domain-containing protein
VHSSLQSRIRCGSAIRRAAFSWGGSARPAYTLVEMLIVVVLMGLAAAMVIPSMAQASSLKVQGALRMLVADITVIQSDAVAFQENRAIVFRPSGDGTRYIMCEANGLTADTTTGVIQRRYIGGETYGLAQISATVGLAATDTLIFDSLGGPIHDGAGGSIEPAPTATIAVSGSGQNWQITVEAFTGRVTIQNLD